MNCKSSPWRIQECTRDACLPHGVQSFVIFMQFSAKKLHNDRLASPQDIPESATFLVGNIKLIDINIIMKQTKNVLYCQILINRLLILFFAIQYHNYKKNHFIQVTNLTFKPGGGGDTFSYFQSNFYHFHVDFEKRIAGNPAPAN